MSENQTTVTAQVDAAAAPAAPSVITETTVNTTPASTSAAGSESAAVAPAPETIVSHAPAATEAAITSEPAKTEAKADPTTSETKVETQPDILGGTEEVKTETKETKSDTETKPEEKSEAKVTELPVYEAFTLPEGINLDKEPMDAFTRILGEVETGKLDHPAMQAKGQELIDLAVKNTQDSLKRYEDYLVGVHEKQKGDWFEALKDDPELGRNRIDTTVSTVRSAVEEYGGTPEQISEFRQLMKDTGVTNNPSLIRLINNMQSKINRYETETDDGGSRMRPAARPVPVKLKPYETFYGSGK